MYWPFQIYLIRFRLKCHFYSCKFLIRCDISISIPLILYASSCNQNDYIKRQRHHHRHWRTFDSSQTNLICSFCAIVILCVNWYCTIIDQENTSFILSVRCWCYAFSLCFCLTSHFCTAYFFAFFLFHLLSNRWAEFYCDDYKIEANANTS